MSEHLEKRLRDLRGTPLPAAPNEASWAAIQQRLGGEVPARQAPVHRRWWLLLPLLLLVGTCGYYLTWRTDKASDLVRTTPTSTPREVTPQDRPTLPRIGAEKLPEGRSAVPVPPSERVQQPPLETAVPTASVRPAPLPVGEADKYSFIPQNNPNYTPPYGEDALLQPSRVASAARNHAAATLHRDSVQTLAPNGKMGGGADTPLPKHQNFSLYLPALRSVVSHELNLQLPNSLPRSEEPVASPWSVELATGSVLGREQVGEYRSTVNTARLRVEQSSNYLTPAGEIVALSNSGEPVLERTARTVQYLRVQRRVGRHGGRAGLVLTRLNTALVASGTSLAASGSLAGLRQGKRENYFMLGGNYTHRVPLSGTRFFVEGDVAVHRTLYYRARSESFVVVPQRALDYPVGAIDTQRTAPDRFALSAGIGGGYRVGSALELRVGAQHYRLDQNYWTLDVGAAFRW